MNTNEDKQYKGSFEHVEDLNEYFEAYDGTRPYIFVSYAHKDSDKVFPILNKLHDLKYRIWYDAGLKVGKVYTAELCEKVSNCNTFIIFLSSTSIVSKHCASELSIAFDSEQVKIIPIWLEPAKELPKEMKYWLGFTQQHTLQFSNGPLTAEIVTKLLEAIPDVNRDTSMVVDGVVVQSEEFVKEVEFGDEVIAIGNNAFKNRLTLEKVNFTNNIERIGNEAFRNCKNLSEVILPKSITKIGDSVFRDCIGLKKLSLEYNPGISIEIGERAFENCTSLTEIYLPKDLSEIYSGVFNSCKSLEHIILPSENTVIGDNAFASCEKLKEIEFPQSTSKLDDAAFSGCISLKEINITPGITKIGKNAFKDCINVEKINISKNLARLDSSAFRGCTSLSSITIDPKNRYLKIYEGVLFNKNKSAIYCYPCKKEGSVYEVPDSVIEIMDWAFCDCSSIKELIIPDSVERIGEGAFYKCSSLEKIFLPSTITKIDDNAFRGCTQLKEVIVDSEVITELGWGLFYGCHPDLVVKCHNGRFADYCKGKYFKSEIF